MPLNNDKWFVFHTVPNYTQFHTMGCEIGFCEELEKNAGVKLQHAMLYFADNTCKMYFAENEWREKGKLVFNKIKNEPEYPKTLFKQIRETAATLLKFAKTIPPAKELPKLTDKELMTLYDNFFKAHNPLWSIGMVQNLPEFENEYVSKYILTEITERLRVKTQVKMQPAEVFSLLVTSRERDVFKQESIDMFQLCIDVENKKLDLDNAIEAHSKKYYWTQYNFTGPVLDKNYFKEIAQSIIKQHNAREKLEELLKEENELPAKQNELLKSLEFSKEAQHLISYGRNIGTLKAVRMDPSYFAYCEMERVLKEIAKRLEISISQVRSINARFMQKYLLDRNYSENEIPDSYKHSLNLFQDGKWTFLIGKPALEEYEKQLKFARKEEVKNELHGTAAFPGKVTGKINLIFTVKDLDKMQQGDILVSPATSPDLVPAMKKAGAILTDVGGVTCHAAIISRELKIPCIVGLKSVTRNFKEGDLVEVDANSGIVRKIE